MAHHYPLQLHWTGNTLDGTYNRNATVTTAGKQPLAVSSAPEYVGDATRWNPEDLLGTALATCHMLTFLAICARKRIVVDAYEDDAVGVMTKNEKGRLYVSRCTLRPRITWGGPAPSAETIADLHHKSHLECFIANSVLTEVRCVPRVG